jgi:hypothetical protein
MWRGLIHGSTRKLREVLSGRFAATASDWLVAIMFWAVTGPIFHYFDTWQLIMSTGTTIVTLLMVILIANSRNRDARAFIARLISPDLRLMVTCNCRATSFFCNSAIQEYGWTTLA